jgi:methyltransferase family protein
VIKTVVRLALDNPLRVVGAITSDPLEAWASLYDHVMTDWDRRRGRAFEGVPADLYSAEPDWEKKLHRLTGSSWPCSATAEFRSVYAEVVHELEAKGIRVGPETFKGNNDGDAGLVRAIWCLVRHLRPRTVVETGVAHGMTSRLILEALERNGGGRLWSIDRPTREPELRGRVGMAVADRLRDRWTLIRGASRRHLPGLLRDLGQVDLFVHDSLHTEHNVRFELDRVWPNLRPGGAIVVDDIDANWGFQSFMQNSSGYASLVCEAEPTRPDVRRFNEKGLFGILVKGGQAHRTQDAAAVLPSS